MSLYISPFVVTLQVYSIRTRGRAIDIFTTLTGLIASMDSCTKVSISIFKTLPNIVHSHPADNISMLLKLQGTLTLMMAG